jgi:metallophosphoesterase (TIGR00282 family)
MGEAGIQLVERLLPALRKEKQIDVVIAQAENVTQGKGLSVEDFQRLKRAGVDGFSGGNHSLSRADTLELIANNEVPVTAPANMPETPGQGYKYIITSGNKVLIISLLGQIVGRDAAKSTENPLATIDKILESQKGVERAATIVNFHGDFSSEKVVIGHYLDGLVTAVIGDHWHVPTADARVLPGGTAHMSDVGMVGVLNASLGVEYNSIIPRWRTGKPTKNILASKPPYQFNAVLVEVDENGLARSVEALQQTLDN